MPTGGSDAGVRGAVRIAPQSFDGSPWRGKICKKGRGSMEDIAARRAAESLLAEHKANVRFRPLGPPDEPATISYAVFCLKKKNNNVRSEHKDTTAYSLYTTAAPQLGT